VVHRDLKLDNILVHFPGLEGKNKIKKKELADLDLETEDFTIKICDLGFSREI